MMKRKMTDCKAEWNSFLVNLELAMNYDWPYQIQMHGPTLVPKNPGLEQLLPTMLFIRLCSILDDRLKEHLENNALKLPAQVNRGRKYRNDLESRIRFLAKLKKLKEPELLQNFRRERNDLSHKPGSHVCWQKLYEAIDLVEGELQNLGFIGERPKIGMFGRSFGGTPVPPLNRALRSGYSYGVRLNGKQVCCFCWYLDKPIAAPPGRKTKSQSRRGRARER